MNTLYRVKLTIVGSNVECSFSDLQAAKEFTERMHENFGEPFDHWDDLGNVWLLKNEKGWVLARIYKNPLFKDANSGLRHEGVLDNE